MRTKRYFGLALVLAILMLTVQPATAAINYNGWIKLSDQTGVSRSNAWVVDLTGKIAGEIVGINVVKNDKFIPTDVEIGGSKVTITPVTPYEPKGTYTLRIFLNNGKRYCFNFTTGEYDKFDNSKDNLIRVPANPQKGFNYPYYLWVPKGLKNTNGKYILVEPNNTGGVSDDLAYHEGPARDLAEKYNGHGIAAELNIPFLVPVLPRPATQGEIYTHELDRDTMLIKDGDMKRLDLQFIAMIKDAQSLLAYNGIKVNDKVFMNGFSASAKFVNRFTIMHPEMVRAVAAGGINGIPTFPTSQINGATARYPVGIADLKNLTGITFNMNEYKKVSQYIYMGEKDTNDDTLFWDAYDKEDADLVHRLIGYKMMPDRWQKSESIYKELGIQAQFVTYKGIGHEVPGYVWNDLDAFFKANSGNEIVKIKPHQ